MPSQTLRASNVLTATPSDLTASHWPTPPSPTLLPAGYTSTKPNPFLCVHIIATGGPSFNSEIRQEVHQLPIRDYPSRAWLHRRAHLRPHHQQVCRPPGGTRRLVSQTKPNVLISSSRPASAGTTVTTPPAPTPVTPTAPVLRAGKVRRGKFLKSFKYE